MKFMIFCFLQLKNGDLRIILLFEELLLLKEFEKRENFLQEAMSSKLCDRDEMSDKVGNRSRIYV